jgi:hypothetical protein
MSIVSIVPGALGKRLQELQRWLDPDSTGTTLPHLPIVAPFASSPPFLPLEQHIQDVCRGTAPFELSLGSLVLDGAEAHLPIQGGVAELSLLRRKLLTGKYAPDASDNDGGQRAVIGRARETAGAIEEWEQKRPPSLTYLLQRIELMAQYPDGAWYERDFYTLEAVPA